MKTWIAPLALLLAAGVAQADEAVDKVYTSLKAAMPSLQKSDISNSPVPGVYEVNRGLSYFYVTADGRYVFSGDLVDLQSGESITENNRKGHRLQVMNDLPAKEMIVFPAKNEKYVITVFTDIDCGYCRKLHREMADYNNAGITVRYLFYPRSGPNTPSFAKAESVMCAKDRNAAMTTAKQGGNVESKSCKNSVKAQFEAGQAVGVRGTPALVLEDGSMQPGYLPADRLLALLKEQGKS